MKWVYIPNAERISLEPRINSSEHECGAEYRCYWCLSALITLCSFALSAPLRFKGIPHK